MRDEILDEILALYRNEFEKATPERQEVLQEAMREVLKKSSLAKLRAIPTREGRAKYWGGIVRNIAKRLKSGTSKVSLVGDAAIADDPGQRQACDVMSDYELRSEMKHFVETLTDEQSQVFRLHVVDGLPVKQMARRLSMGLSTCYRHAGKVGENLRALLKRSRTLCFAWFLPDDRPVQCGSWSVRGWGTVGGFTALSLLLGTPKESCSPDPDGPNGDPVKPAAATTHEEPRGRGRGTTTARAVPDGHSLAKPPVEHEVGQHSRPTRPTQAATSKPEPSAPPAAKPMPVPRRAKRHRDTRGHHRPTGEKRAMQAKGPGHIALLYHTAIDAQKRGDRARCRSLLDELERQSPKFIGGETLARARRLCAPTAQQSS